ncbi:MAG: DNA repair protein RecO [Elusimicrobiota bacterium]
MKTYTSAGIVIKREKHLESDDRLIVFTKEWGRLLLNAKLSRRLFSKLRSVQEPFVEADFYFAMPEHAYYGRLISGKVIDSHQGLRNHLLAYGIASQCCEVINNLLPFRAPSPDVFDILRTVLRVIPHSQPRFLWVLFLRRFLWVLGHGDLTSNLMDLCPPQEKERWESHFHLEFENKDWGQAEFVSPVIDQLTHFLEEKLMEIHPWKLKSNGLLLGLTH